MTRTREPVKQATQLMPAGSARHVTEETKRAGQPAARTERASVPASHPRAHFSVDVEAIKRRHLLLAECQQYGIVLQGTGRRRNARCPFHEDHAPSLTVYLDSQRFHCFGCGASGDVIEFVGRMEGIGFRDAVQFLEGHARSSSGATRTSSEEPARHRRPPTAPPTAPPHGASVQSSRSLPQLDRRRSACSVDTHEESAVVCCADAGAVPHYSLPDVADLSSEHVSDGLPWQHPLHVRVALLTVTAALYREALLRTSHARAYLDARGIPTAVSHAAFLGYADGVSLLRFLAQAPALQACARRCGLLDSHGRETLRGRIVIPEMRSGLCVWVHGRLLESAIVEEGGQARVAGEGLASGALRPAAPKYLGCSLAKPLLGVGLCDEYGGRVPRNKAVGLERAPLRPRPLRPGIIVVEGAFDLLTLLSWQVPYRCVALIGTHASAQQLRVLVALAKAGPIWLALDADAPGEAAAQHLAHQLAGYSYGVERLRPPDGAKDFAEVATRSEARTAVLRALGILPSASITVTRPNAGVPLPMHAEHAQGHGVGGGRSRREHTAMDGRSGTARSTREEPL